MQYVVCANWITVRVGEERMRTSTYMHYYMYLDYATCVPAKTPIAKKGERHSGELWKRSRTYLVLFVLCPYLSLR